MVLCLCENACIFRVMPLFTRAR